MGQRRSFIALCFIAAMAAAFSCRVVAQETLIVDTIHGPVAGHRRGAVWEFKGLPFASPPTGDLRWRPTIDPVPWDTVLVADDWSPPCPQKHWTLGDPPEVYEIIGDEDCLYLNVWTPDQLADLPVMVFIHGGGNQQGSTSKQAAGTAIYDGFLLAERGPAVVVTVEYRLGPLGFLVHPGLDLEGAQGTSGNYGLLDQIHALKWVRNNIDRFGGDPERVLVFGESGGAVDVAALLASPVAAGTFTRAAIQSGAPTAQSYDVAIARGLALADTMDCAGSPAEQIDQLRDLHPDTLVSVLEQPFSGGLVEQAWGPVVDGWVLPMKPGEAMESGAHNRVPLLVGSNADETAPMVPAIIVPAWVDSFFHAFLPADLVDDALALYPPGDTVLQAREAFVQATTDGQFTRMARLMTRAVAGQQTEPVWRYFFTHRLSGENAFFGSYHGLELFFVFQTVEESIYADELTILDEAVTAWCRTYWVNFADTGDPNGPAAPDWPVHDPIRDTYLDLDALPSAGEGLRPAQCDFWDAVAAYSPTPAPLPVASEVVLDCFPNPFNPSTILRFDLERGSDVCLEVFDVSGRRVRTLCSGELTAGTYRVRWDGNDARGRGLAAGIYLARVQTDRGANSRKLVLVR